MDDYLRTLERAYKANPGDIDLESKLNRELRRVGRRPLRPMLLLPELMINKDKPKSDEKNYGWGAEGSSHLAALSYYLPESVKNLAEWSENDYQGSCYALLKVTESSERFPVIVLWRDGFGSCSGCDSLKDANGAEYIEETLHEGNTRQFWSIGAATEYLKSTTDFLWGSGSNECLAEVEKLAAAEEPIV